MFFIVLIVVSKVMTSLLLSSHGSDCEKYGSIWELPNVNILEMLQ